MTEQEIPLSDLQTQSCPTEPTDPVDPVKPEPTTGTVDKFGTKLVYPSTQVVYNYKENFRNDGKRFDFNLSGRKDFQSVELTAYVALTSQVKDEISGKLGGGKHSDGSRPKVYDLGFNIVNGVTRYRTEEVHPKYSSGKEGPKGIPQGTKFIGYKFIKKNLPEGVLLEIWQDAGNNEDNNKPASNQWKRIASWVENKYNWKIPPGDHQETLRIDDPQKKGLKQLKIKNISLSEIKA